MKLFPFQIIWFVFSSILLVTSGATVLKTTSYIAADEDCSISDQQCQTEQVHLAFGEKTNDIAVTWSTLKDTKESIVQFWEKSSNSDNSTVTGKRTMFGTKHKQWIHRATLHDLKYDTQYEYKAGSKHGMSKVFSFKTPPAGENFIVNALFFGDMGIYGGKQHKTVAGLKKEVESGEYHVAVHNGDLAYDLQSDEGKRGDAFLKMVEPIAANIPYMTTPGNHEVESCDCFNNYKNRFTMPGNTESMYYSFNLGPAHFIACNTEVYYNRGNAAEETKLKEPLQTHYNWLVQDLKEANKKENREKHPWIILYAHRPMYCSSKTGWDRCRDGNKDHDYAHRVGIPKFGGMAMEPLLKEYGVDMVIWAHEHYYERAWPLYKKTVYNGTQGAYINPGAPVHITTGAAGNNEGNDAFVNDPLPWSAFRSRDFGYGRLRIYNHTHLYWDEMSTDRVNFYRDGWEPTKIDEIWLVKDEHKPYNIK